MQEQDLKNQDALIAHNRQTGESGVVTGLKQDGTPQMEDPAKASVQEPDNLRFLQGAC